MTATRQTRTAADRAREEVDVLTRRAKRQNDEAEKHETAARVARAAHRDTVALLEHAKAHPALRNSEPESEADPFDEQDTATR